MWRMTTLTGFFFLLFCFLLFVLVENVEFAGLGPDYMVSFSPGWNFAPPTGLKYSCDYMHNFSPGAKHKFPWESLLRCDNTVNAHARVLFSARAEIISSYPASLRRRTVLVNFQAILLIFSGQTFSNRVIFFTEDAAKFFFSDLQNFITRNAPSVFPYLVQVNDNGSYHGLREPIRKLENHYPGLKIY